MELGSSLLCAQKVPVLGQINVVHALFLGLM